MASDDRLKPLLDQLGKHIADRALLGRVQVDLIDMLEACRWFDAEIGSLHQRGLNRDELESLLIDIEVKLLDHMSYHIKSMKSDMPKLLKAVETPDS